MPKGKSSGKSNSVGLIATHALTAKGPDQADSWILDSGATCHICSNQKLFDEIELKSSQEVTMGDDRVIKAAGCGTIKIKLTQQGGSYQDCTLYDVLYVPELSLDLLSIARVTERHKTVMFNELTCNIVTEDNEVVGNATAYTISTAKLLSRESTQSRIT